MNTRTIKDLTPAEVRGKRALVRVDFNDDRHSASLDAALTTAIGDQVKVLAWYDNEMGYSQRLFDLAKFVAEKL